MKVYAFDTDGTLETSAGPVTVARLRELIAEGHKVAIVSPSAAHPKDENGEPAFFMVIEGSRSENLDGVRRMFPDGDAYIYVSDNGDLDAAAAAAFEYVDPQDF